MGRAGSKKATLSSEFDTDLVFTSTGTVSVEVETFGGDTLVHAGSLCSPHRRAREGCLDKQVMFVISSLFQNVCLSRSKRTSLAAFSF